MKYKVIGWTDYEDNSIEDGACSDAVYYAIIDDIRANRYCFSGYAHQELSCGVPVLNDGKKRCFSQRSWGGLMAKAHGYNAPMDYSLFAFSFAGRESEEMPSYSPWLLTSHKLDERDLCEEITVGVTDAQFEKAARELTFLGRDLPALRYLDVGDTLTLCTGEARASYLVKELERGWDNGNDTGELQPIFLDDIQRILYCGSDAEKSRAKELYENGKRVLSVRLAKQ